MVSNNTEDILKTQDMIDNICHNSTAAIQIGMCIEECSELAQALSKYRRMIDEREYAIRAGMELTESQEEYNDRSVEAKMHIIEEMADVLITIEEVKRFLDISSVSIDITKTRKLKRQLERMGIL